MVIGMVRAISIYVAMPPCRGATRQSGGGGLSPAFMAINIVTTVAVLAENM